MNQVASTVALGAFAAAISLGVADANATILTECGASSGHEYFFQGPLVSKKDSGWHKGGISKGQIILIMEKDVPRIIFKHAMGMSNTVSDGAEVVFLGGAGGVIAILVSWPNESIENYLFYINKEGFGEVVWGTFRYDGMNNKGSVFQAECRAPGK